MPEDIVGDRKDLQCALSFRAEAYAIGEESARQLLAPDHERIPLSGRITKPTYCTVKVTGTVFVGADPAVAETITV